MRCLLVLALLFSSTAHADPDARDADAIRAVAVGYQKWRRVDESPNIALGLCRAPKPADWGAPSHVRRSEADQAPHGRKLYYLWASDKAAYLDAKAALPVGFAIVKESFEAVPSKTPPSRILHQTMGYLSPIDWMVTDDGEQLVTGKRKDLFIMTKVGDRAGSDAGWIYGTVAPDGTVTSAGRVESCRTCHVPYATHERLFGLAAAPKS